MGIGTDVDLKLAKDILRHYLRNPQVVDSLEGVARWRLLDERIHETVAEVQKALEWLVDQGFLERKTYSAARSLFCFTPGQESRAKSFVLDAGAKEGPNGT